MKARDARVKFTNELLQGVRILKLFAWEVSLTLILTPTPTLTPTLTLTLTLTLARARALA